MTTTTVLKKWGKDIALVLPDTLVEAGNFATGNRVEVNFSAGSIVIQKSATSAEIGKMCDAITSENMHTETSWGVPQGREVW